MKLSDLIISGDRRAILVGGVWNELPKPIDQIKMTPACEKCPRELFEHCIIDPDFVSRKAGCEMVEESRLFTEAGNAPMPQVGALFKMKLEKEGLVFENGELKKKPVEVVSPEPKPEPPKKGLLNRIKNSLVEW